MINVVHGKLFEDRKIENSTSGVYDDLLSALCVCTAKVPFAKLTSNNLIDVGIHQYTSAYNWILY